MSTGPRNTRKRLVEGLVERIRSSLAGCTLRRGRGSRAGIDGGLGGLAFVVELLACRGEEISIKNHKP